MKLLIVLASFAIILLFLVITAVFLERHWRKYQAEQAAKSQETHPVGAPSFTESIVRWMEQLWAIVQPASAQPHSAEMAKAFRAWVMRDLAKERDLQSWLLALPEPGVALLTNHLADFCKELNFDLKWLLDQQAAIVPELKAGMQAAIIDYCRACRHAIPVQKQARLFADYQQLCQNPPGKDAKALSHALYANLTTHGLVAPSTADLSNATAEERQQQVRQAIQQSAATDWARFAPVLQATLAANNASNPGQPPVKQGPPGNGVPLHSGNTSTRIPAETEQVR